MNHQTVIHCIFKYTTENMVKSFDLFDCIMNEFIEGYSNYIRNYITGVGKFCSHIKQLVSFLKVIFNLYIHGKIP